MFDILLSVRGEQIFVQGHASGHFSEPHALGTVRLDELRSFARAVAKAAEFDREFSDELVARAQVLYRAIFQGEFQVKLIQAKPKLGPFVVRWVIDGVDLQAIPWEALVKPGTREGFLAKGTDFQVIRGVPVDEVVPPCPVDGRLRILIVGREVSTNSLHGLQAMTNDAPHVQWLEPLVGPDVTWKQIFSYLRTAPVRPHVLHFVGHGGFKPADPMATNCLTQPTLGLSNDTEDELAWINAETLADEIKANGADELRLVMLESCEGAASGGFGSAAQMLVRSGVHAVASYLWPVRANDALEASKAFYQALTLGHATRGDVITSLCAARRTLLVNRATGLSLVLHARTAAPLIFDFAPPKKKKKEKPNVLANESRSRAPSERPAPIVAPVQTGSHTSIVIDRIRQWQPILGHCASKQTHLVFVVHGTAEQNLALFMKRIKRFLPPACSAFGHHVVDVEGKHDRIPARTANEWKRCLISKTIAASGEFATVFPNETMESAPVFLFMLGEGPLRLDTETVKGLVDLFHNQIDREIRLLELDKKLKHPLRFVLPVERAFSGVDLLLDSLVEGLRGMKALHLEDLAEIGFPPWAEVWEFVEDRFKKLSTNAEFQTECRAIYNKVAQAPGRTLQALGDALHPVLYAWDARHT